MPVSTPPAALEPPLLDSESFRQPIDFIRVDHERQAEICSWLEACAGREDSQAIASAAQPLLRFFTEDLPRHALDEEEDLFPLLRQRCAPEDGIERVLDQLSHEHLLDKDLVGFLVEDLEALAARLQLPHAIRFFINLKAFAMTQVRHLAWENTTVLPLAERRLSSDDLAALTRSLAGRRGFSPRDLSPRGLPPGD